ncbi:hypothetical protein ACH5RR_038903 [Cinchona calisaya]|uniref:Protein FAR1-RELATED SEQUENCE n=1 Tax=Cinchona calisaya TaxID=153742 RepID=A0ABD2Y205_9GENT
MMHGDTGGVLEYLQKMQLEDPNSFYAIQVDEDDLITNIFWLDAKMRTDYADFGDVRLLDDCRYEESIANFRGSQSTPAMKFPVQILQHAASINTFEAFEKFKDELCRGIDCKFEIDSESGNQMIYRITPYGKKFHDFVTYDSSKDSISCRYGFWKMSKQMDACCQGGKKMKEARPKDNKSVSQHVDANQSDFDSNKILDPGTSHCSNVMLSSFTTYQQPGPIMIHAQTLQSNMDLDQRNAKRCN